MKKPIKWTIIGLAAVATIVGSVYYMMMPMPVRMTPVRAQLAELTFMEQGIVTADSTVLVFSVAQGELNGIYVREGQNINAGDTLISVDDTGLRLQLEQIRNGIRSLEAQMANVGVEDAAMRQNLQSTRNSLQGELQRIDAQASETQRAVVSSQEAIGEQVRIQQVLIDQHQSELDRARENFHRIDTLHQSGVATLSEYEIANSAVIAAQTQLEAAQGQMSIIAAGTPEDSAGVFAGMRASINAQIAGINQQLAQDTTTAARAHFEAMIAVEQANVARLEREIENAAVTAPVSGIITNLHAQGTNFISPGSPVAEITVPGNMSINAYVSTQDISSINIGDTVRLTLRQRLNDIEFTGLITEIDNTAVVRLSALGVEERKVNVSIEPQFTPVTPVTPGSEIGLEVLGIGHGLDVHFYVFREENRIVIPRTAVFRDSGQDMVWVVQDAGGAAVDAVNDTTTGSSNVSGLVRAVPVVTGLELRTDIIIESGLNEGDFVINDANNPDLRDGARVINE